MGDLDHESRVVSTPVVLAVVLGQAHGSGAGILYGGCSLAQRLPSVRALYGSEGKGVTSFLTLHLGLDLTSQTSEVLSLYT